MTPALFILDERTSALSLKQAAQVLKSIEEARDKVFP
jgi:ABC-type glutathione transport system ATPase component